MSIKTMKFSYITVVTKESYVCGAWGLAKTLVASDAQYPLVIMVPTGKKNLFEGYPLDDYKVSLLEAEPIAYPGETCLSEQWRDTLFKLRVFSLVQFDKIVFLDSDMVIMKNIDQLFTRKHMTAVAAGTVLHSDWIDLNSGLMVIVPNTDEYNGMLRIIPDVYEQRLSQGFGLGDQDVIEAYYSDWKANDELHLSEQYNCMLGYAQLLKNAGNISAKSDIFVYHFTGKHKPWQGRMACMVTALKAFHRSHVLIGNMDISILRDRLRDGTYC